MHEKHSQFILFKFVILILVTFSFNLFADEDRAKRPFARINLPEAHLSIPVPTRPAWTHQVEPRSGTYAVLISTPEKFYPSMSMEVVLNHRLSVDSTKLKTTALSALKTVRENSGSEKQLSDSDIKAVTYGKITGYEDTFTISHLDQEYSVKSVMGIMPSGHPISLFLATPKGQMTHIEDISNKIWKNIKEISDKK